MKASEKERNFSNNHDTERGETSESFQSKIFPQKASYLQADALELQYTYVVLGAARPESQRFNKCVLAQLWQQQG